MSDKKKFQEQVKQSWRTQTGEEFPALCKAFLSAYYTARAATTVGEKLTAIKDFYDNKYDFQDLKVAEFFILTQLKMI